MRPVKRAMILLLALAAVSLAAGPARAQNWFGRPLGNWRPSGWSRYAAGGQLAGGEIVGGQAPATLTAAQYQQLVTAQARQTPVMSAAQYQQMVAAQAQQPPNPLLTPAQQFNVFRAAAAQQQQPQNAAIAEALRQLQQQQIVPPHPPLNGK